MKYEAPKLFVEEYVPDTMIASILTTSPKDDNAGNNQNCWGCKDEIYGVDPVSGDACCYIPNTAAYTAFCL